MTADNQLTVILADVTSAFSPTATGKFNIVSSNKDSSVPVFTIEELELQQQQTNKSAF